MIRKTVLILVIIAAAGCLWMFQRKQAEHHLTLRAYYPRVQHVEVGMPVCVDGVEVGTVASVTVRPELGDHPLELVLKLCTAYQLNLPSDSIAQIAEPGILRPNVVDIDTRTAHGAPVVNNGSLVGRESMDDQAAHALGVVVKAAIEQTKQDEDQKSSRPSNSGKPIPSGQRNK